MKKNIIWLIQSNQITPTIYDFLKTFQTRMEKSLNLLFMVPDSSSEIMEKIKEIKPTSFKTSTRTASDSTGTTAFPTLAKSSTTIHPKLY